MCINFRRYWFVPLIILYMANCKKPYNPPAITASNSYLVVDGVINTGANSVTNINLNRTRKLSDSVTIGIPELNARVSLVSGSGSAYPMQDKANNGIYTSQPLSLDNSQQYKILVTTADGRNYSSELVSCKQTPPIDSLYWEEPSDLTFYINTHDPSNNTHYYRWEYIETWQHNAQLTTPWGVRNGRMFLTDSTNNNYKCWSDFYSSYILLGTSTALNQDLINRWPIETMMNGDHKLDTRFSLLVRQYALTLEAYNYWLLIQKTSQAVGTLFDLQPSQLYGNIHCLTNPNEPVIGFLSASYVQQKRIFVNLEDLPNWKKQLPPLSCPTKEIAQNPVDFAIYDYPDTTYAPYYFTSGGTIILTSKICLDCTLSGGTTNKPSFWQ